MQTTDLQNHIDQFVTNMKWKARQKPKDLVMALTAEVGELSEHFMWVQSDDSHKVGQDNPQVASEIADCAMYILQLATECGVDLEQAILDKLADTAKRFPVEKLQGQSTYDFKREQGLK